MDRKTNQQGSHNYSGDIHGGMRNCTHAATKVSVNTNISHLGWGLSPLPILRLPEFLLGVSLGTTTSHAAEYPFRNSSYVYLSLLATFILLSLPIGSWVSFVVIPFASDNIRYCIHVDHAIYVPFVAPNGPPRWSELLRLLIAGAIRDLVRVASEQYMPEVVARVATPSNATYPCTLLRFYL